MKKKSLKIAFFGTSDFAEIILENLLRITHYALRITSIVTQPDQPVGRKKILTPPPVKVLAEKHKIPILQPATADAIPKSSLQSADLFIVADYGKIIPQHILDIPKYGTLNVHPSLLPKYRGPSPIQNALLNGDKTTGTSIMLLDKKMDHGPIISHQLSAINYQDNYKSLSKRLAKESAELLIKTLPDYVSGKIKPQEQEHSKATFTKIIKKEDGQITSNKTAQEIYNMWRAYTPWPGIFFKSRIKNHESRIKLLNIELVDLENKKNNPLELFVQNKNLYLSCTKNSVLKINQLQPQGKKIMDATSFINGYLK